MGEAPDLNFYSYPAPATWRAWEVIGQLELAPEQAAARASTQLCLNADLQRNPGAELQLPSSGIVSIEGSGVAQRHLLQEGLGNFRVA